MLPSRSVRVHLGGPDWTKSRTEADSNVTPSCGMGIEYVRTASPPTISMPCTKLRTRALRSGKVPSWKSARKSATYPLISLLDGSSARRCSNWVSAPSRAAVSWPWRLLSDRMRGDSASMGNCLVSNASNEVLPVRQLTHRAMDKYHQYTIQFLWVKDMTANAVTLDKISSIIQAELPKYLPQEIVIYQVTGQNRPGPDDEDYVHVRVVLEDNHPRLDPQKLNQFNSDMYTLFE